MERESIDGIMDGFQIHDQFRLELKLGYGFSGRKKISRYRVETFFMVPSSLGINERSFTKLSFYNNIQNYIRLKTPEIPLLDLLSQDTSPFSRLKQILSQFAKSGRAGDLRRLRFSLKMFVNITKSSMREFIRPIKETLPFGEKRVKNRQQLRLFLQVVGEISSSFKSIEKEILAIKLPPKEKDELLGLFSESDEYLSLILEKACFEIGEDLGFFKAPFFLHERKKLLDFIEQETAYRKRKGYVSIVNPKTDNELWVGRFSQLKKSISNPLFLNVTKVDMGKTYQNIWFALAAGMAMFVFMALSAFANWKYGNFTAQFILVVILAYMFKDRLKEGIKEFMANMFSKTVFDYETRIEGPGSFLHVGKLLESFYFVGPRHFTDVILSHHPRLPSELDKADLNAHSIYCHVKEVIVNSGRLRDYFHMIHAVNDISRYNLTPLLTHMDNPETVVWSVKNGSIRKLKARRVYPVKIYIRFTVGKEIHLRSYLLELNREGIVRMSGLDSTQNAS